MAPLILGSGELHILVKIKKEGKANKWVDMGVTAL